jgi:hypothetical protein
MITDPDDSFIRDLVIGRRISGVVNDYRRPSGLNNVDRDVVDATQGQNLWFASPFGSLAYGIAVFPELCLRH